jgi:hypothetical protein
MPTIFPIMQLTTTWSTQAIFICLFFNPIPLEDDEEKEQEQREGKIKDNEVKKGIE